MESENNHQKLEGIVNKPILDPEKNMGVRRTDNILQDLYSMEKITLGLARGKTEEFKKRALSIADEGRTAIYIPIWNTYPMIEQCIYLHFPEIEDWFKMSYVFLSNLMPLQFGEAGIKSPEDVFQFDHKFLSPIFQEYGEDVVFSKEFEENTKGREAGISPMGTIELSREDISEELRSKDNEKIWENHKYLFLTPIHIREEFVRRSQIYGVDFNEQETSFFQSLHSRAEKYKNSRTIGMGTMVGSIKHRPFSEEELQEIEGYAKEVLIPTQLAFTKLQGKLLKGFHDKWKKSLENCFNIDVGEDQNTRDIYHRHIRAIAEYLFPLQ